MDIVQTLGLDKPGKKENVVLNLTHADISALMQRAYNTVVERDSKIQKVFDTEKPLPVILTDIFLLQKILERGVQFAFGQLDTA